MTATLVPISKLRIAHKQDVNNHKIQCTDQELSSQNKISLQFAKLTTSIHSQSNSDSF